MGMSDVNGPQSSLICRLVEEQPRRVLASPIPVAEFGTGSREQVLEGKPSLRFPDWKRMAGFPGTLLFLEILVFVLAPGPSFGQTTVNLFSAGTPAVVDSGSSQAVVLGIKVFSDVPGQILGCSFYKALTNTGIHVVSLWDSAGKVLATQAATAETASGKQWVMFSSPVSIAANQTVTCGYFAPNGHFSYDTGSFAVQKNVLPLHVPINGGCTYMARKPPPGRSVPGRPAITGWMCCSRLPPDLPAGHPPGSVALSSARPATQRASPGIPPCLQTRKSSMGRPRLTATSPRWT